MSVWYMPFGKYRDRPLAEVPKSYLQWLVSTATNLSPDLRAAIQDVLEPPVLRYPPPDPETVTLIVNAGVRALAREHHPDVGGDLAVMTRINSAAQWLKSRYGESN
jgi:hypothetical protein